MPISPEIQLLCGRGPEFGNGHFERIAVLLKLLEKNQIRYRIYYQEKPGRLPVEAVSRLKDEKQCLWIVDARDQDLEAFKKQSVLTLDNRCEKRKDYERLKTAVFIDTLPHPDADLPGVLSRMLIDPALLEMSEKNSAVRKKSAAEKILVYGDMKNADFLHRKLRELSEKKGFSVFCVGSGIENSAGDSFLYCDRMDKKKFYSLLLDANIVITYFGMLYFEALFLGKKTYLYLPGPENSEHDVLSRYFSDKTGLPYFKDETDFNLYRFEGEYPEIKFNISSGGYDALLGIIKAHLK